MAQSVLHIAHHHLLRDQSIGIDAGLLTRVSAPSAPRGKHTPHEPLGADPPSAVPALTPTVPPSIGGWPPRTNARRTIWTQPTGSSTANITDPRSLTAPPAPLVCCHICRRVWSGLCRQRPGRALFWTDFERPLAHFEGVGGLHGRRRAPWVNWEPGGCGWVFKGVTSCSSWGGPAPAAHVH